MILPKELEPLRNMKIWLCYPLIWNEKKHSGVGGYDKPPINPYTLYSGMSNDPKSLATFEEAAAQIGKTARVKVKGYADLVECKVAGVGIALSGTGVLGMDLDNVVDKERKVITPEAGEIVELLDTYAELSPSGTGLHILFFGKLPGDIKKLAKNKRDIFRTNKAEYQLFDSGYMTVSGDVISSRGCGKKEIAERTDLIAEVYEKYFREVAPIEKPSTRRPTAAPPVVSSSGGFTYERWLEDVKRLSDAEILERIFESGSVGKKVAALYSGDTSEYGGDHSRADQALCTYLYGFTSDRELTERLFRSSSLYRAVGKSRSYLDRTLNKAAVNCKQLVGHIELTAEEKRAYAKQKEKEEFLKALKGRTNSRLERERKHDYRRKI